MQGQKDRRIYLIPAALIVNSGKEILLIKKSSAKTALCVDRWEIPGGTLKFGEKFKDGAKRKVKQYLGLDIEVGDIIPYVHSNITTGRLNGEEVEMQFYVEGVRCTLVDEKQELQLQEGRIKDARWFSKDEYLRLAEDGRVPGDLEIIRASEIWSYSH